MKTKQYILHYLLIDVSTSSKDFLFLTVQANDNFDAIKQLAKKVALLEKQIGDNKKIDLYDVDLPDEDKMKENDFLRYIIAELTVIRTGIGM